MTSTWPPGADPDGPEARAHAAITATVAELRGAVSDLHPYLLEEAGLAAAIGQAARAGRPPSAPASRCSST